MSAAAIRCDHCGTLFSPQRQDERFCCGGCRFVSDWIEQEGLDRFYDLKGNRITEAIGNRVFEPTDWEWAETWQQQAETETKEGETVGAEIRIQGMSCLACAWLLEKRFLEQPGSLRIDLQTETGTARLYWQPSEFSATDCFKDWSQFGYQASESRLDDIPGSGTDRSFLTQLGVCGAFALNTMAFTLPSYFGLERSTELGGLFSMIAFASASLAVLTGGSHFFRQAWNGLRMKVLHIDFPIALGIAVAYLGSIVSWIGGIEELFYVDFVAIFVFLMLLGRWVQQQALAKAQQRLSQRANSVLDRIERQTEDESYVETEASSLQKDDLIRVRPGKIIPVAAMVMTEPVSISLEWINGEPESSLREVGQIVPAGAKLLNRSAAEFRAQEAYADGILGQLFGDRPQSRDPLLERVLKTYLIVVLIIAVLGAAAWVLFGEPIRAIQVFVSILVVSCPCALGVAVPLVNSWTTRRLERFGVFVRNTSLWPRLLQVRRLAFDKTGTLTLATPRLCNPEAFETLDPTARQQLLRLVENNRHPFARGIHEALGTAQASSPTANPITETPGSGVQLQDQNGEVWSLGRDGWRVPGKDHHQLVFGRNDQPLATFSFREAIRPDAAAEIATLSRQFPGLTVLSGDRRDRVIAISEQLSIPSDHVHGGLSPADKAEWLQAHEGDSTLFLGDGANDSLAFDAALCSGMPAVGQALLETKADFCFLGQGLRAIRELFAAAHQRQRAIHAVFAFALLYNLIAIALCLAGQMNPLLAAVLMPLSSLATIALAASTRSGKDA